MLPNPPVGRATNAGVIVIKNVYCYKNSASILFTYVYDQLCLHSVMTVDVSGMCVECLRGLVNALLTSMTTI